MKIYISRAMSGIKDLNFPAFHAAATYLRNKGFEVVSPAEIEQKADSWHECMR